MYLQKLEIQGFKSFANKTSLEFTPGVTAIVGPNGSGKSNIADAVRWVLGEQSLKTLRGKKSGDVIFAGSDKKTRLGYCQVDLYLNNEDHKAPVDFTEIVISRRLYRDGEGEYFINKNKVRLQDILLLLAKSNFGQRSYSIISQGMVDLFLSATPTQRKEYFDEAAGVRQFQIKKDQAENKLSQTKENLRQAELLIQEIAPRLRSLTRQVNRLERREEVTKKLKEVQHQYYSGLWHDLHKQHHDQESKYKEINNIRKKTAFKLEELQKQMQQLASGTSRQDIFRSLQKEYDQLNSEKNNLLREQAVLKGKLEIDREQKGEYNFVWLEKRKEQLDSDIKNIKDSLKTIRDNVRKNAELLLQKETDYKKITEKYQEISARLTVAKEKLTTKETVALPEISQEIEKIYNFQKSLLEKIEIAQTPEELGSIKAEAKTLTTSLGQLNQKLKSSGMGDPHDVISLQDQITDLLATKDKMTEIINEIKIKLQIEKEREVLNQNKLNELSAENDKITRKLSELSANKSLQEIKSDLAEQEKELAEKITKINNKLKEITQKIANFNQEEQKKKEEVFSLQDDFSKKQQELNTISSKLNDIKIELAKIETRKEDLGKEMVDEMNDEERETIFKNANPPKPQPELFTEIQKLKRNLELIGGIDPQVAEEYKQTKERHDFLTQQSEDLNKAVKDLETAISNLEETIKKQFGKAFEQINKHFTQYFKILFNGGNASLSMVKEEKKEEEEEVEEREEEGNEERPAQKAEREKPSSVSKREKVITGIDIHATPPGKRLKGIAMLSGGERALTSIALICAIIHSNPSPFVILDEVDAALDESNSIRFASIIDRLSKKTQFVIITHNRATMNKSHILYGVTMGDDGVSKLLSIDMEEAEKVISNNK